MDEVETTIQELSDRVEVIASTLRTVANSAWNAEDAATEARTLAEQLNDDMQNLARIAENPPSSEATSYAALRQIRQQAWIAFSNDAAFRRTNSSPKLAVELKTYLELPIDPHDWLTYHYGDFAVDRHPQDPRASRNHGSLDPITSSGLTSRPDTSLHFEDLTDELRDGNDYFTQRCFRSRGLTPGGPISNTTHLCLRRVLAIRGSSQ